MWGMAEDAGRAGVARPADPLAVTVLWASQTGNAEIFAAQCAERLKAEGHLVTLAAMNACKLEDIPADGHLLLIASTFGDGDPPDNGTAFWQTLQGDAADRLKACGFAVLAFAIRATTSFADLVANSMHGSKAWARGG